MERGRPGAAFLAAFRTVPLLGAATPLEPNRVRSATVLVFELDPHVLGQLEKADLVSLAVARAAGDVAIYDPTSDALFTPEAFSERRVASWSGARPDVPRHLSFKLRKSEDGTRQLESLGMNAFGFADLQAPVGSAALSRLIVRLLALLAQRLVEAGGPDAQGRLELSVGDVEHEGVRREVGPAPSGHPGAPVVALTAVVPADPPSLDVKLRVDFAGVAGATAVERAIAAATALFGSTDKAELAAHDAAMNAASARAIDRLMTVIKPRFLRKEPGFTRLSVKAPFATRTAALEWMWINVQRWEGMTLTGVLDSDPSDVPQLRPGAQVSAREQDLYDYILDLPDGGLEGNETGKMLQARGRLDFP